MVKYVKTDDNIIIIIQGLSYIISHDDESYDEIFNLIRQNNETKIKDLLSAQVQVYYQDDNWKITKKQIIFHNIILDVNNKFFKFIQNKIKYNQDYKYIINFFNRFNNKKEMTLNIFELLTEDIMDQTIMIQNDGTFFTYSTGYESILLPIIVTNKIYQYDPMKIKSYPSIKRGAIGKGAIYLLEFEPHERYT